VIVRKVYGGYRLRQVLTGSNHSRFEWDTSRRERCHDVRAGTERVSPAEEGKHLRYAALLECRWFRRAQREDLVAQQHVVESGKSGRAVGEYGLVELGAEVLVDVQVGLGTPEIAVDDREGGDPGLADRGEHLSIQVVRVEHHGVQPEPREQLEVLARGPDSRLDRDVPGQDLVVGPRHGVAVADEHHLGSAPHQLLGQRQAAHHMPDPPRGPHVTPDPDPHSHPQTVSVPPGRPLR